MWKTLRIVFTILCAVCLAAILPAGALGDLPWVIGILLAAAIFFTAMLFCKNKQEQKEYKDEPKPDFFSPSDTEKSDNDKK